MPPYLGSDCARSLSSSAQVAITNYHRLGSFNNRNIYFSKAWKLKVKDQDAHMISVWGGLSSWFTDGHLLIVALCGSEQREEARSLDVTNPIKKAPLSESNHLPSSSP